jgi:hypothetical protein
MLYLHEVIDIVGTGQEKYVQTVIERAAHSQGENISRLVGCWKVIGSTNRWPRVVNLWEMDGWSHWAKTLERQFVPEKKDPALAPWWAKATQWRSGGFDRILEPAAYSPTRAQLVDSGLRAWVCVHTLTRTRPGKAAEYLDRVGSELRPVLEKEGMTLFGAYRVPMRSDETLVLWASPSFDHACGIYGSRTQISGLRGWEQAEHSLIAEAETMWLVPANDCFFHPTQSTQ